MPPENLVDYTASPEEPSLDAMRYALTQRSAIPNPQQRPLDSVTDTLKRLATEFNPLMMGRTLQDAPKILYNATVAPVASTWAGALRNIQAAGAGQAYGALGMQPEAAAAQSRMQPVTTQSLQAPLRSVSGQQTQEALGEAFNALRLPPMGPGSGMPGTAPLTPRPMLTPNDVRVMGAQAAHAIREAGQIPTDIANVRNAGIQRMSPLTGEPSVGSRLGSAIEGTSQAAGRVGDVARGVGQSTADYMQMRRDMGLSPVPGVPPEFMPDLNMYAVRPTGTALTSPKVPETKNVADLSVATAPQGAVIATGADKPRLNPSDALAYLTPMDMDPALATNANAAQIIDRRTLAFEDFMSDKAHEMYPDAPSADDAMRAFNAQFSHVSDRQRAELAIYDEFRASPEGQAVGMQNLPSSQELQDRHAAAGQWLNSTFLNYVRRHLGAEGDPAVQLASQGLTVLPAEDIRRSASMGSSQSAVEALRRKAGMPEQGTVAPAIDAKSQELADAQLAVIALETQRGQYRDLAMQQGLPDPAMLPEYAATTNPLQTAVAKRDKLQGELENLQLGKAYEDVSDLALDVNTPKELLRKIQYEDRQFYPAVTRAQPDEKLYTSSSPQLFGNTGLDQVASQFYDDVMRGNLPIEKLKGLTVEKYIRGKAEGRVAEEKRQAQAAMQMKAAVESRMQEDMAQYVKPENYFGNVGVLELSTSTGFHIDEIRRLISDDTLALDHCVAEGPTPGSKDKNLWRDGADRRYMPLVDPATGQLLPGSPRRYTRYISEAGNPDPQLAGMLASVRDKNTGVPVATIEFKHLPGGKYSIGYASGWQNGVVKKAYHDAIKQYLNSRANVIQDANSDLDGVGLIDLHSTNAVTEAMSILGVPRREAAAVLNQALDSGQLPRFGSSSDLRQALESPQPAAQQPAAPQPFTTNDLTAWLDDWRGTGLTGDITRALSHARQGLPTNELRYAGILRDHPTEFAAHLVAEANRIGDGELPDALRDLAARITRSNAPQQPAAPQPAAQQTFTYTDLRDFIDNVRRDVGANEGAAIRAALAQARQSFAGMPAYTELLRDQPTAFAERISEIAQQQNNAIVEQELLALADRIAPPVPPAQQPANPFDRAVFPPEAQDQNAAAVLSPTTRLAIADAFELAERAVADDFVAVEAVSELARIFSNRHLQPNATISDLRLLRTQLLDEIEFFENEGRNRYGPAANALRNALLPVVDALLALQQPAQQQLANFDVHGMARDLLENARRDNQTFDTGDLGSSLFTLTHGNFDDFRFRALGADSAVAQGQVADALRQLMQDAGIQMPGPQQIAYPANAAAEFDRAPLDDAMMNFDQAMTELAIDEGTYATPLREVDRMLDELRDGDNYIYGLWEGDQTLTAPQRDYLIRQLQELRQTYEEAAVPLDFEPDPGHPANQPGAAAAEPPADNLNIAPFRRIPAEVRAMDSAALADQGMAEQQYQSVMRVSMQLRNNNNVDELRDIIQLIRNHTIGAWENFSPEQREYLARELQNHIDNPQRGYANGGTVSQPQSLDAMKYELMMRSK